MEGLFRELTSWVVVRRADNATTTRSQEAGGTGRPTSTKQVGGGGAEGMAGRAVVVHVYEFEEVGARLNSVLTSLSLGVFHTGVEVQGYEYSFNDTGVFRTRPKAVVSQGVCRFKESLEVGVFDGSANELRGILAELRSEFGAGAYHLMRRNCNHFSDALCQKLVGVSIPAHLNRVASIGAAFVGANSKACQVQAEAAEAAAVEAPPPEAKGFFASLFSDTKKPQPPKKKKQLTPQQQALLDKVKTGR